MLNMLPIVSEDPVRAIGGLTPEQLRKRRNGIGASELGAVLGLDAYKTGYAVWLAKTGQAVDEAPSIAARRGQYLEPLVAELYGEAHPGSVLTKGDTIAHPLHGCILATPDYYVRGSDGDERLLEIKTKTWRSAQGFGGTGTDEVPDVVQLQVQQQLLVTGRTRCDVAVLVDDQFKLFHVEANAAMQAIILGHVPAWWQRHVVEGLAPNVDGSEAAARHLRAALRQVRPEPRIGTDAEEALMRDLADVNARLKTLETQKALLTQQLMQATGEDAGIITPAGRFTWSPTKGRATTQWETIARAAGATPQLIAAHTTTGEPTRTARFTPTK